MIESLVKLSDSVTKLMSETENLVSYKMLEDEFDPAAAIHTSVHQSIIQALESLEHIYHLDVKNDSTARRFHAYYLVLDLLGTLAEEEHDKHKAILDIMKNGGKGA